ncbi:hypothetical protein MZE56_024195 [Rahnella perminowiae]|nr:hypothetical protein [Rahnella perminowiae]MCR9003094.1 hypothetical protein [Rahnella perminowiae]
MGAARPHTLYCSRLGRRRLPRRTASVSDARCQQRRKQQRSRARFKQAQHLRIAARDISRGIAGDEVSDHLTYLAGHSPMSWCSMRETNGRKIRAARASASTVRARFCRPSVTGNSRWLGAGL